MRLAIVVLFLCLISKAAWTADRWAYLTWAKREFPGTISSALSTVHQGNPYQFTKDEIQILHQYRAFLETHATMVENGNEIYDFAVPFKMSSDQKLFKLSPNEPARTAVTSAEPTSPIFFNEIFLQEPKIVFGASEAMQLIFHEVGRKVVPEADMLKVDALGVKLRKELQKRLTVFKSGDVTVTVPLIWHALVHWGEYRPPRHPINLLYEKAGTALHILRYQDFDGLVINGKTFVPTARHSVGDLTAEQHGGQPLANAEINPTAILSRQAHQVVDALVDVKRRTVQLRIEHTNGLMSLVHPGNSVAEFHRGQVFYELELSWKNEGLKASDWSHKIKRENSRFPIKNPGFKAEIQFGNAPGGEGLKIVWQPNFQYRSNINLIVRPAGLQSSPEIYFFPSGGKTLGKEPGLLVPLLNFAFVDDMEVVGVIIDKKNKVYFDEVIRIPSKIGPKPASLIQLKRLSLISDFPEAPWIPSLANDFNRIPPVFKSKVKGKTVLLRLQVASTEPVRTVKLSWQEALGLKYEDFSIASLKIDRTAFFTENDFKQVLDPQTGIRLLSIELPKELDLKGEELGTLQRAIQRMGLSATSLGVFALTQLEIFNGSTSYLWNEFANGAEREYFSFQYAD